MMETTGRRYNKERLQKVKPFSFVCRDNKEHLQQKRARGPVIMCIDVSISPTKTAKINIREGDCSHNLANNFARNHNLPDDVKATLEHQLQQHLDRHKKQTKVTTKKKSPAKKRTFNPANLSHNFKRPNKHIDEVDEAKKTKKMVESKRRQIFKRLQSLESKVNRDQLRIKELKNSSTLQTVLGSPATYPTTDRQESVNQDINTLRESRVDVPTDLIIQNQTSSIDKI